MVICLLVDTSLGDTQDIEYPLAPVMCSATSPNQPPPREEVEVPDPERAGALRPGGREAPAEAHAGERPDAGTHRRTGSLQTSVIV